MSHVSVEDGVDNIYFDCKPSLSEDTNIIRDGNYLWGYDRFFSCRREMLNENPGG